MTDRALGRGWKRSVVKPRRLFAAHPLSRAAILDSVDLVRFTAPLMDQGPYGSCTGHATSDAIFTSFGAAGTPLDWVPSQRGIYGLGRAVTRSRQGFDPLTHRLADEGAYPSDVMEGISMWGIRPMGERASENGVTRFSDCGSNVNDEASGLELEEDALHLIEEHAVYSATDVMIANSSGFAVPTGFFVDMAFEQWSPGDGFVGAPKNPRDPLGGGHYVDTVGYTRAGMIAKGLPPAAVLPARMLPISDHEWSVLVMAAAKMASSEPIFFVKNSWALWGLNGFFLATREFFDDPQTGDMNAITAKMKEAA